MERSIVELRTGPTPEENKTLIFGPGCTYKSPKDVDGKWLNDLPSQRMYPQIWAKNPTK